MLNILAFIFIFILAILLLGLSLIGTVIRRVLGMGRKNTGNYQSTGQQSYTQQTSRQQQEASQSSYSQKKKVFDDDEGEYVEFEEIKEE